MRKKILIISNNPLSQTRNNGKTLYSFFKNYPEGLLGQIYFENSYPDFSSDISYYRVTDKDNLKCILKNNRKCGEKIKTQCVDFKHKKLRNTKLKQMNVSRLLREWIWANNNWKSYELDEWLKAFDPDVIFFYAGDCIFAYKLVDYILAKTCCDLGVYVSDDYILPRKGGLLLDKWRRKLIKENMKKCVEKADYFFTISSEMREIYKKILGKDSNCIMNIPQIKNCPAKKEKNMRTEFIYCGGLEFGREKTLAALAKGINDYNKRMGETRAYLSIYSLERPSRQYFKKLNLKGSAAYKGGLNKKAVEQKISDSDIVVHVESFKNKNIENTRLSISTKISEYLSSEKPILAIGPSNIASMNYLCGVSMLVNDINNLDSAISKLVEDERLKRELSLKAITKYKHMAKEMNENLVINILVNNKKYSEKEK